MQFHACFWAYYDHITSDIFMKLSVLLNGWKEVNKSLHSVFSSGFPDFQTSGSCGRSGGGQNSLNSSLGIFFLKNLDAH